MAATTADLRNEIAGMDDAYEVEIARAARTMERPPYLLPDEKPPVRLSRAIQLVRKGWVVPQGDGTFVVKGSEKPYILTADRHCPCPRATNGKSRFCYHVVAVELFIETEARCGRSQPGLPLPPVTVDERLAQPTPRPPLPDVAPVDDTPLPTAEDAPMNTVPVTTPVVDNGYVPAHRPRTVPNPPEPFPHRQTGASMPQREADVLPESAQRDVPASTPQGCVLRLPTRSIAAIITDLSKPLPSDCVASKSQGGTTIAFLHWQTVLRVLDTYAPGWHGRVVRMDQVGKACAITYRLTIPCAEGRVSREATGQEDEEVKGYGNSTSNSEAMAFKRAAAKFGLGAWLYSKDATDGALTKHLQDERLGLWRDLGTLLDKRNMLRQPVLDWLLRETGMTKKTDVPIVALKALLAHLTQEVA